MPDGLGEGAKCPEAHLAKPFMYVKLEKFYTKATLSTI